MDKYPYVGALLASALIFYNGYRIYEAGDRRAAIEWWMWAAAVLVAFSIGAAYYRMWIGLSLSVVGLLAELFLAIRLDLMR